MFLVVRHVIYYDGIISPIGEMLAHKTSKIPTLIIEVSVPRIISGHECVLRVSTSTSFHDFSIDFWSSSDSEGFFFLFHFIGLHIFVHIFVPVI